MKQIYHYSVFAAAPGGGKQVAILEGVDNPVDMQRIAAESGQPLTGFILNAGVELVEARFFSPTKEKGSSDSGALVIGEHLRQLGRVGDSLTVQMGDEGLEVLYQGEKWWSKQADHTRFEPEPEPIDWLRTLFLDESKLVGPTKDFDPLHGLGKAGDESKQNMVVMIYPEFLDEIRVDFDSLSSICKKSKINGLILLANLPRNTPWDFRFFAPHKGIQEDNAGSFTLASLCGFMASFCPGGSYVVQQEATQGRAMGKPSKLYTEFKIEDGVAKNIMVGGKVETL